MGMTEYQIERQKIKLKPCPFCGGEARLRKHQKLEQTWYVQCKDCGIRTPNSVQPPYESWKTTMNYPVQQWNRRVEDGKID
jgi:Lar family restriction alleviation protein